MSVSLSLKLAEFPQNETIFDRILIAEFFVKIAAILNISTGQLISELVTRAIFTGPVPFLLTRDLCHIDYPPAARTTTTTIYLYLNTIYMVKLQLLKNNINNRHRLQG